MMGRRAFLAGGAALFASRFAHAAGEKVAIAGATLHGEGEPIAGAIVIVQDGLVQAIGTDAALAAGARTIDATGKVLTAGLVDPLTRLGLIEVDLEKTTRDDHLGGDDPIRAAFRAADGYNPASSLVRIARLEGLTSIVALPTEGLVCGQSCWADLDGPTPGEAIAAPSTALHVVIDDWALGSWDRSHGTALLRLRELIDDARAFQKNRRDYDKNQLRKLGASRLDLETVVRALEGKLPVVVHVDRASDIVNVLALAKEFGLKLVLASAAEAWRVAPAIAAAAVPVIVYPLDDGPRTFAALGAREDNAALLERAGVTVALSTGESHNARKLRQVAGNAVRAGMSHRAALAAVTEVPARIYGLERYGAPKAGRVANLVVWSADPFELSSRAEQVLVRGRAVELRSRQTELFERYR